MQISSWLGSTRNLYFLLQASTIFLLIGRGWQFIFKSTPFNAFLTHPIFMEPVLEYVYRVDWKTYLTDSSWDNFHMDIITGWGIYFWICAFLLCFIKKLNRWVITGITTSSFVILFFLSFCYSIDKGFQIGMIMEHSLQVFCPLFLLFFYKRINNPAGNQSTFILALKIATALTFIGHGLYAVGYHPTPGFFVDMMIKGFGTTERQSILLLRIVGYLDIALALAIFIPWKPILRLGLGYIIIWGFLTALARVYANFSVSLGWYSLKQWIPEFLMRVPHFLLPLVLFAFIFMVIEYKKDKLVHNDFPAHET